MATINPFYRFEDAIQVGSLGERGRIISLALDEIYNTINVDYTGQTIQQVLSLCNGLVQTYNSNLQANFLVDVFYNVNPNGPYPVQIFIYDTFLAQVYPLHKISLILIIDNGTNDTVQYGVYWMGTIPPNYNYSEPLCQDEIEACKALASIAESGSGIFPKTYTYDSQTGVASSILPRLRPCKYNTEKGIAERFPADTYARGAKPATRFDSLSPFGKAAIAYFNRSIKLAQTQGTTLADIQNDAATWVLNNADVIFYDDIGPTRLQITICEQKPNGEAFVLVIRSNNGFTIQRFYAPIYLPYNILTAYLSSVSLPYPPNELYMYGGIYYDFDFCNFETCQFPKKENYLMPIKSGDEFQFNVLPYQSNTLPYDSVDVGIFDENYNLVAKIGTSNKITFQCDCDPCDVLVEKLIEAFPINAWQDYRDATNQFLNNSQQYDVTITYRVLDNDNNIVTTGSDTNLYWQVFGEASYDDAAEMAGISFGQTLTNPNYFFFRYVIEDAPCDKQYKLVNTLTLNSEPPQVVTLWETPLVGCQLPPINDVIQNQATALIPNLKNGCYRFGLYKYSRNIYGAEIEIASGSDAFPLSNNSLPNVFIISDQTWATIDYIVVLPYNVITWEQVVNQLKIYFSNIITSVQGDNAYAEICGYNSTYQENDGMFFGQYNFATNTFTYEDIGATAINNCQLADGDEINEVYAFSNLLDFDDADCFSTIMQFWATNNSIASGFEYYNDWFQQIRLGINGGGQKPVITESIYRQSNGISRRPQNKQDLSIDLHTDFLDLETQSALVDATRHPNFVVDGKNLFVNGDIEVATTQDFTTQSSFEDLAQVKFSALVQGYQPKNSTCINC